MTGVLSVQVDLARCEVVLGSRRVLLEPSGRPVTFRLGAGTTVCGVTFGERSRVVQEAHAGEEPHLRLREILRASAISGEGGIDAIAVALALAGGGVDAPGFDTVAVQAARQNGWDWQTLSNLPAIEVDRAAASMPPPVAGDSGWKRFVFAPAREEELESLCLEMTRRLLDRGLPEAAPAKPCGVAANAGAQEQEMSDAPATMSSRARPAEAAGQRSPERTGQSPGHRPSAAVPPRFAGLTPQQEALRAGNGAQPLPAPKRPLRANFELRTTPAPEGIPARWSPRSDSAPQDETARHKPAAAEPHAAARATIPAAVAEEPCLWPGSFAPSPEARLGGHQILEHRDPESLRPHCRPDADRGRIQQQPAGAGAVQSSTEAIAVRPVEPGPGHDWLAGIARALADECDLRGLDV